jgi:broad specificity phosphatase PhoE
MKRLYFIRHGLSEGNISGIWSGRTDSLLTRQGRAQAIASGEKTKKYKIDLIVSSPLSRTRETAEIIADTIGYPKDKILYSDLFIERHFGDLEGRPHGENDETLDLDTIPNIESKEMILDRADRALKFLEKLKAENILVVSHGSFGRALRHHLFEETPFANSKSSPSNVLPNGEVLRWI